MVEYTCDEGYTFIDGETVKIAYCDLETLQWIGAPTQCYSKLFVLD